MLRLNAGGRGFVLPPINVPDLLTPHGSSYTLGGVDARWAWGGGSEGFRRRVGRENCDWNAK